MNNSKLNVRLLSAGVLVAAVLAAVPATANAGHDPVRMNQVQVIGTHNSFHTEITDAEKLIREQAKPGSGTGGEEYSHAPIAQQLEEQHVRSVELDLMLDNPTGGRFTNPLLRQLSGEGAWHPEVMDKPGIKVMHEEDVDYRSTCLTFVDCLQQVKAWSDKHRDAVPITILLQFDQGNGPAFPGHTTQPLLPWTKDAFAAAEKEVLSVFPRSRIITPDDLRHRNLTLHDSVQKYGWPTLKESRGKVLFGMDNLRNEFLSVSEPSLNGRLFFTNAQDDANAPDAAFMIRDEAPQLHDLIQSLVKQNFLIRSRADSPNVEAKSGDTTRREAALTSGAQVVSTDYPGPGMSARFGTGYYAELPTGNAVRCNPVNAPRGCKDADLEKH
ncbi:Ca2+-dependent phosphoinositide-specific phospholipase C [Kribbella sp. NPDC051770]|uniref:Ca2+-dependent phosphoinositide-specific phospholipase C n=1 Tax=Kribbella sp. NPDC051770 TaxID=3155413 RepID=UPI00341ABC49